MKLVFSLLGLLYFLLPHDLFPDVFLGWGWLDDLVIAYFIWRIFYRGGGSPGGLFQNRGADPDQSQEGPASGQDRRENTGPTGGAVRSRDPYDVLQLPRDASQDEIRTAYKDLAGKYHPDKVQHLGEEFQAMAEERFKEIQEAYQKLRH